VRRYVIAASARWVRDFDIDGFRVDAAWGVRRRAPDFWPHWRAALKRIKPDLLLLAEASARDPYYTTHGFDAAYDWTDKLGQWAWHDAFDAGAPTASRLSAALAADATAKGLVFRFLDNNDTGARFITRHGVAPTRLTAAMLMTLPGIPLIYMGEEVGAAFKPYAAAAPIDWRDPAHLRPYYTRLVRLRHALPALRSRALQLIDTTPEDRVLAYLRPGRTPTDSVLVVLNYGNAPATAALQPSPGLAKLLGMPRVDRLSGERITLDPAAPRLALPAFGLHILQRASARGE
jgi:glycosidase